MNESIGWIKLHRNYREHWLFKSEKFSKSEAWLDLLMLANWEDRKILFDGELIHIKRGSFITSKIYLGSRWGWHRETVASFLKLLKSDSMIEVTSDNRKTEITICNYSKYQDCNQETFDNSTDNSFDNSTDNNVATRSTQLRSNKKIKEVKEDKKLPRGGKVNIKNFEEFLREVPEELKPDSIIPHIKMWVEHRQQKGDMITRIALSRILSKYQGLPSDLCRDIDHSLEKGWTGIFPPSGGSRKTGIDAARSSAFDIYQKTLIEEQNDEEKRAS